MATLSIYKKQAQNAWNIFFNFSVDFNSEYRTPKQEENVSKKLSVF